jgi:cytochrome c-type biogenesis protein CcmH/NrfG
MDFHQAERYLRGALLLASAIWSSIIAYDSRTNPVRLTGSMIVALVLLALAYFAIGSWPAWE